MSPAAGRIGASDETSARTRPLADETGHTGRHWVGPVVSSSLVKFLAMPLTTALVAMQMGLKGPALTTALVFQVPPTASSAYIMARQLGGDATLMAGITAAQTVLAFAAIPLVLIGLTVWSPL